MSTKFPFVDASFAAEILGVQTSDILDLIDSGRLKAYGGKERNPFVRTADVEALAGELGRETVQPPAKRRAADNPVRRIELRLRADSRWADVTDDDLTAWIRLQDEHSVTAARKVAETAMARIGRLLEILGDR